MTEQHEPTGGIRGQLRNLAERGSFDGEWGVLRPQLARVGREVSIPGDDSVRLRVNFQAERFAPHSSRAQLLTRYSLKAVAVYEDLPIEVVPGYVKSALRERHLNEWNEAINEGRALILPASADGEVHLEVLEETMRRDIMDIDDTEFRFEREVGYVLDGRGQLLSEQRSDCFYDADSVHAVSDIVGVVDFRSHDGSIASWIEKTTEPHPIDMDLLTHPDLRKLECKMNRAEIDNFLRFAELVSTVEQDRELVKASRRERQQEILSLLAFLRYDAPAGEIMNLLQ